MKNIIIALITLLIGVDTYASFQRPDGFSYKGKEYRTNSRACFLPEFYMEHYFKKYPEKRPRSRSGLMSTGLYRGYVATYEIKESQLVLSDIQTQTANGPDKWESVKHAIIADDSGDLVIDWFTGIIVLYPRDELIDGKRRSNLAFYEGDTVETLLQFENGKLVYKREFVVHEYKKFKAKRMEAFRKTSEYQTLVEELRQKYADTKYHYDSNINNWLMDYTRNFIIADDPAEYPVDSKLKRLIEK